MTASGEGLDDVMSAIRRMVHKETSARFDHPPKVAKPKPAHVVKSRPVGVARRKTGTNLPSKIFILQPYMRVDIPKSKPEILDDDAKIPHDTANPPYESFAIAEPVIDENMLRDMVKEVVQEQLRGELGKQLILSMKRDILRSLT